MFYKKKQGKVKQTKKSFYKKTKIQAFSFADLKCTKVETNFKKIHK